MWNPLSPLSLSINPSDGRDPGGWILKFKGRAKTNLSSTHCSHFGSHVCLNGKWQVVLITFLSLCLPAGSQQPTLLKGWHSVLVQMFCLKMPGPLSFPLSPHHTETFLIAFLFWESKVSLYKMRNNQ